MQTQSTAIVSLWDGYEAQLSRVLETRVAINKRIAATMPNGYMCRDFAIKNSKVHAPIPLHACFRGRLYQVPALSIGSAR